MAKNSPKWAKLRLCYVFGHTISSGFVHFILIYNISFGFSSKRAELSQTERNQACLNCSEVQPVMHGLKAQQAHSPGQAKRHPGLRIPNNIHINALQGQKRNKYGTVIEQNLHKD